MLVPTTRRGWLAVAAMGLLLVTMSLPLTATPALSHLTSTAAAAPNQADPIVGDWNVTYGAPALVTMTLSGGVYTETAKTVLRVTDNSCDLPAGTIIATFSSNGDNTYSGQHGLWQSGFCTPAGSTSFSLTLNGNTLTGSLGNGETHTFTREC